ncbi:flagellar hook protein FlgE [Alkalimarinus alittae]|uniref:Flagellar hook protein FlgE n=1 Tax=Alkalimarinus alittae TaxID=2961619 RepID=A0ABY6N6R9_9ALTE|nr:flagellar hook protein FlgE [Alkalimarinus alittae]UZE97684.1 flagellar hook protein FlgE [Alkalimarinus alittae]
MPFNVALSGLRASSTDLEVTGNNIANASTVGFKQSRTEFGDIYSNSFLSGGVGSPGSGVEVQNVRQLFDGGNISGTDRSLDLAIKGRGFYVLNDGGETKYSRAGQFGVDKDGFVVNSNGMNLQGFVADEDGNVGGVLADVKVEESGLEPRRTTLIDPKLNLDSSGPVLEERGVQLNAANAGTAAGVITTPGAPADPLVNTFPEVDWTITLADGTTAGVLTAAGASAGAVAASLSALPGVDASASTSATIVASTFSLDPGDTFTINQVPFTIGAGLSNDDRLEQLAQDINTSSLGGVSAVLTGTNGGTGASELTLNIIHNQGGDLKFNVASLAGSVDVAANENVASSETLNTANNRAVVAGILTVITDEGSTLSAEDVVAAAPDLSIIGDFTGVPFLNNEFNPLDSGTYNHATSTEIYDSLGNSHIQTMYFVKKSAGGAAQPNTWQMHVQIDGKDVGDPVVGVEPTRASFWLVFNPDGSMNTNLSDQVLISNWNPLDAQGNANGAAGPNNVVDGGSLPIPDPASSSNFEIDMGGTTQYGSPFSVNDMKQNGYTTGRLVGLDVDDSGMMFARYTNGESRVLNQIALANFNNEEGLSPSGGTAWVQTFDSGSPIVGAPGTASLGSIKSSSVEESNVNLSDQLVNLIIAQRNYQANAKTIETADQVTQTILNI